MAEAHPTAKPPPTPIPKKTPNKEAEAKADRELSHQNPPISFNPKCTPKRSRAMTQNKDFNACNDK